MGTIEQAFTVNHTLEDEKIKCIAWETVERARLKIQETETPDKVRL